MSDLLCRAKVTKQPISMKTNITHVHLKIKATSMQCWANCARHMWPCNPYPLTKYCQCASEQDDHATYAKTPMHTQVNARKQIASQHFIFLYILYHLVLSLLICIFMVIINLVTYFQSYLFSNNDNQKIMQHLGDQWKLWLSSSPGLGCNKVTEKSWLDWSNDRSSKAQRAGGMFVAGHKSLQFIAAFGKNVGEIYIQCDIGV